MVVVIRVVTPEAEVIGAASPGIGGTPTETEAITAGTTEAEAITAGTTGAEVITTVIIGEGVITGATTEAASTCGSAGLAGTTLIPILIITPILLIITLPRPAFRHCRRSTSSGPRVPTIPPRRAYGITALNQNLIIPMSRNAGANGRRYRRSRHQGQGGNIMRNMLNFSLLVVSLSLGACVVMPTGPSVMSLPGSSKSFEEFRADDAVCRQYAYEQIGGVSGQQAAQNSAVTSAAVGTALGAAAGAVIGSASGDAGGGAAIGGGAGLLVGSAAGSNSASVSYYESQRRYDHAYLQCMYAKGNQVPGYRRSTNSSTGSVPARRYPPPPPPARYPPPPPASR